MPLNVHVNNHWAKGMGGFHSSKDYEIILIVLIPEEFAFKCNNFTGFLLFS
jgi:hypothetical protein